MATLKIHHESITAEAAEKLVSLCPFGAITYDGRLEIGAGCKMCGICEIFLKLYQRPGGGRWHIYRLVVTSQNRGFCPWVVQP